VEGPATPEKPIVFTRHAQERCRTRGATEEDVIKAIRGGKREAAQRGLWLYRLNLQFQREWAGTWYAVQQVSPVVDEETERLVVITVFTFYF
jgi:bifunctional N-acetylglucosamine-1-phosphate-uridyltransferase/glucosamine-1-phosphate-acetyltransferase GlmU-like protein